jgi:hypothetical protein
LFNFKPEYVLRQEKLLILSWLIAVLWGYTTEEVDMILGPAHRHLPEMRMKAECRDGGTGWKVHGSRFR